MELISNIHDPAAPQTKLRALRDDLVYLAGRRGVAPKTPYELRVDRDVLQLTLVAGDDVEPTGHIPWLLHRDRWEFNGPMGYYIVGGGLIPTTPPGGHPGNTEKESA